MTRAVVRATVISLILAIAVAYILAMLFDRNSPRKPYNPAEAGIVVPPQPVIRGEQFKVDRKIQFLRSCPGEVHRYLISVANPEWAATMPATSVNTDPFDIARKPDVVPRTLTVQGMEVPGDFPLGLARYVVEVDFYCNWVQRLFRAPITVPYPTITLDVRARQQLSAKPAGIAI